MQEVCQIMLPGPADNSFLDIKLRIALFRPGFDSKGRYRIVTGPATWLQSCTGHRERMKGVS